MSDDFTDFDLRRFGALTPLQQLERLERDSRMLETYEKRMRAAEAELDAEKAKEVKS